MRWLWLLLTLAVSVASAGRLTTFTWDAGSNWPAGTTVELCGNGNVCLSRLTGRQATLDLPVQPGDVIQGRARAVAPTGYQCGIPPASCPYSSWATVAQTWPAMPISGWARYERQENTMAVAYSSFSQIADTDNNNSVSAAVPSGLSSGDLWLVLIEIDTNYDASNTVSVPSGWTAVSSGGHAGGDSYPFARAFYKVAGASESAQAFTLSMPGGVYNAYGASIRITGADTSNPIDTTAFTTASITPPARTVANDGSLSIVWAANTANGGGIIVPTGYTEIGDQNGSWCIYSSAYKAVNAGTETPGAFTLPSGSAFAETIIIKPAGAGGATALPRRAIDGPFYGSLRGSVR